MRWKRSHRFEKRAVALADRHYSRQSPGSPQFMRSGRCLVLITEAGDALWGVTWSYPHMVLHQWGNAWECTHFRNESANLSSELITEAVAATRWYWGEPPREGIITTVNADKVRKKRDPGRCFRKAGWTLLDDRTKNGLLVFQLLPEQMPEPCPFIDATLSMDLIA